MYYECRRKQKVVAAVEELHAPKHTRVSNNILESQKNLENNADKYIAAHRLDRDGHTKGKLQTYEPLPHHMHSP